MAWDVESTKRRLLDAGAAEFSQYGLAGARVDRIAKAAGVNKERIYSYFVDKAGLFDAVAADELGRIATDVPLDGHGATAVAEYAGRMFDHLCENPQLSRLLAWEGLERGADVVDFMRRQSTCAERISDIQAALPGIGRPDAAQLFFTVVLLTHGWAVFPQLAVMMLGGAGDDQARRRRAVVIASVGCIIDDALASAATADGDVHPGVMPAGR